MRTSSVSRECALPALLHATVAQSPQPTATPVLLDTLNQDLSVRGDVRMLNSSISTNRSVSTVPRDALLAQLVITAHRVSILLSPPEEEFAPTAPILVILAMEPALAPPVSQDSTSSRVDVKIHAPSVLSLAMVFARALQESSQMETV